MVGESDGLIVRLRFKSVMLGVGYAGRSARRSSFCLAGDPLVDRAIGLTVFWGTPFLLRLPPRIVLVLPVDELEELVDDLDDIMSFNEPIETTDGAGETVRDLLASACYSSV